MREDYQTFKEDAVRELRAHWLTNRTTVKEAIIDLYQPSAADYAASKTFLSHVDSVAQLRHLGLNQSSTEDLVKLVTPTTNASFPSACSNDGGSDRALSVAVCSTSSESSEEISVVEAWSPSSADSDSDKAQVGDGPASMPLCLTSPSSAGTLLGQVTAPHVDPITPLRREDSSGDSSKSPSSTTTSTMQGRPCEPAQETKQDHPGSTKAPSFFITSSNDSYGAPSSCSPAHSHCHSPTLDWVVPPSSSMLVVPARQDREGEREWEKEREKDRDKEREKDREKEKEKESRSGGEGLRIILLEEANSPASSISSFETPIMVYGQS